jgi:4-amino-4-deoxy-L-arabinose transferase-like glycosyltransferase
MDAIAIAYFRFHRIYRIAVLWDVSESVQIMAIAAAKQGFEKIINAQPLLYLLTLALCVRLYHVDSPILGIHAWRQSDTAAIARNFYENGFNLFYPQVDWGGSGAGYCETEFPIYAFLVALLYKIFGVHDAIGRLFSIGWCLTGIYFLYQLVRDFFEPKTAFWACFFYAILPLSIYYSRTFQAESMLMTCGLISIFYFKKWLDSSHRFTLVISSIFLTIACLMKVLPLIYLGIPLLYLAFNHFGHKAWKQPQLWGYLVIPIVSVLLWYGHAHQLFLTYGNTFGFSGASTDRYQYGILFTSYFWSEILVKLAVRHFAIIGFFIFITGLVSARKNPKAQLFYVWLGSTFLCWVLVPVTSVVHEYYLLPFMIPGVVFMGQACSLDWKKLIQRRAIAVGIGLTCVASLAFYSIDYMAKENTQTSPVFAFAQQIQATTQPTDRIISTTGGDPTLLYLAHRKGWLVNPGEVTAIGIQDKIQQGAKYLVGSFEFVESYTVPMGEGEQQVMRSVLKPYPNQLATPDRFIAKLQ